MEDVLPFAIPTSFEYFLAAFFLGWWLFNFDIRAEARWTGG